MDNEQFCGYCGADCEDESLNEDGMIFCCDDCLEEYRKDKESEETPNAD